VGEECDNSTIRQWKNGRLECWNVEALAEIPLRREKIAKMEIDDCQLPTANCRLPTANCQLPTANCQLPTADCQLPTADYLLPTALCALRSALCKKHHQQKNYLNII